MSGRRAGTLAGLTLALAAVSGVVAEPSVVAPCAAVAAQGRTSTVPPVCAAGTPALSTVAGSAGPAARSPAPLAGLGETPAPINPVCGACV